MAKRNGERFPIGGILIDLISKQVTVTGNYFGGSHLACAASIAVLDVIEKENLMANASKKMKPIFEAIKVIPKLIKVKGRGLMLGVNLILMLVP
jgi:acetylornithine aminotransferase